MSLMDIPDAIDSVEALQELGWGDLPLRPYQLEGVNWLINCCQQGHGCILGDEMGLGKTCQTIALLTYLNGSQSGPHRPHLVVCPRSVLENWDMEFSRFSPQTKTLCFVGDKDVRNDLSKKIKATKKEKGTYEFDALITAYELCMKDHLFLKTIPWSVLVVDEAHRLKNQDSLLYKTLEEWDISCSVLLTGTPVQNNLRELYALLSFIAPRMFRLSKVDKFVETYSNTEKEEGLEELHELLKPYLLRRTKNNVLSDLPNKMEVVLYHGVSSLQKKLYKGILTRDPEAFQNTGMQTAQPRLMNILMQLRKCVNHPYLFDGVEPEPFELGEHLVEASGKLVLIDKLLCHLKQAGHKVLMFSQMTHMLDILQDYLGYRDFTYERLDGSVRGEERFLSVRNFNENDETFVFLLSTKAGGQGINLTAADTVIFVDSDFNPQNDLQAAARAHRIGQTRPVKVIRLVGRNTVEEIVLARAEQKLKLTDKVIESGQFTAGGKHLLFADNKQQLQDVLRFGVDKLLNADEEDSSDIDLEKYLGATIDGAWQLEEKVEEEEDQTGEGNMGDDAPQSMYMFEGTDYSKDTTAADRKAVEDLLEVEHIVQSEIASGERTLRMKKEKSLLGPLPELQRKARKQLTPQELEERKRRRMEAAEKRAKLAEEQEIRRAQEQRKKREKLWRANNYTSCNVTLNSEEEDSQEEDGEEEEEENGRRRAIQYVSGDVTHPSDAGTLNNIIVHCADDAGQWGRGGLFSALSARSPNPQTQYELAGKMKDLALGDCHLVCLDAEDCHEWLTLLIAQHRDKRNNLSGIKLSALRVGLEKIHSVAKKHKASVHLPRIGHNTPGFNWYGTERLIQKHLASAGIPTFIYYFPRRQKRKAPPPPVHRHHPQPAHPHHHQQQQQKDLSNF
ncbi:chromodomain-helicase-DNA-binding protein 1-like [Haliotis rubra]|uniref:chromodomain-helicase-DNA-binding protein 1-like n=1 Tax=Haliotis rubra TaxID=36100 RepID=UPI001EE588FD|nr:chromodomain-helicase-DNA-binding protein 1-like [Haliotis rubra]